MDADAALAFLSEGLERFPDHMGMLFSIACWQAMGGREDEALETLRRAEALDPRVREWVREGRGSRVRARPVLRRAALDRRCGADPGGKRPALPAGRQPTILRFTQ